MTVNKDKLGAFLAGVLVCAGVIGGPLLVAKFAHRNPIDDKPNGGKGDVIVAFVDESARTIPQAIVNDLPIVDAMKIKGMFCDVAITDPLMTTNNLGPLLEACGGSPGWAFMDRKTGELIKATRTPTDTRAAEQLIAKYLANPPPPLEEVKQERFAVQFGGDGQVYDNGYIDPSGRRHLFGALPSTVQMRAAMPSYGASNPLYPESEWREVNHRNLFGPDKIKNQGQISSCVANGWTGTMERTRVLAGMQYVRLSEGYFYSLINHQQDQGAIIGDGIAASSKIGSCPAELIGESPFFRKTIGAEKYDQATKEAKRFQTADCFRCGNWKEACSAVQAGYCITFGTMVGRNWTHFDKNGVCGHDSGPGNHCVAADGMVYLKDQKKWVLDSYNSWGADWGPFKNGRMFLDEQHLFGNGCQTDCCAIRVSKRDPQDPYAPPIYRHKAGDAQFGLAP